MKNIFDYDAQASSNLVGGESAATAVGLPVPGRTPGTFAPGASNATEEAIAGLQRRRAERMSALGQQATAAPIENAIGYNPSTKEFFSNNQVFKADLNEGRRAAASGLFDIDNPQVPPGFVKVTGASAKAKLQKDFESQGLMSDVARRTGQFVSGTGSALRDLGVPGAQAIEQYGTDVAARNPSQIQTAADILGKPLTAAGEAVGEAGFDLARMAATGATGARIGALAGSPFGPAGTAAGAAIGGLGAMGLSTLFETYGSIRQEQREKGIEDKTRALGAAAGSAALETALGPEAAIGRMVGKAVTKPINLIQAQKILDRGALKTIGKEAALGALTEGPLTEVPQSAIERYGAYKPLTGEDAVNEYLIGAFKGGIGGGAITTLTSSTEFMGAKRRASTFVDNFLRDQQLATNTNIDPNDLAAQQAREGAIRRVQDVLAGSSSDPRFDQQLQEFKQLLQRLDYQMALAAGNPVSLLNAPRPTPGAVPPTPLERDRTAEQEARWAEAIARGEAPPELSTLLNVSRAGQQWQDLQARREQALRAAQGLAPDVQGALARRAALISMGGDAAWEVGEKARPLVESLEQGTPVSALEAGQQFDQVMSGNIEEALSQPRKGKAFLDMQMAALGGEPGIASRIPQTPVGRVRGPVSPLPAVAGQPIASTLPAVETAPSSLLSERPTVTEPTVAPTSAPAPAPAVSKGAAAVITSKSKEQPTTKLDEDAVAAALDELSARVQTQAGGVKGRVTLPQTVLGGIMRLIRSTSKLAPIVYRSGVGGVADEPATAQYAEKMSAIKEAVNKVIAAADSFSNVQSNIVPSERPIKGKAITKLGLPINATGEQVALRKADIRVAELQKLRQDVINAVQNLRQVVGNDMDIEAIVAVLKKRVQKIESRGVKQAKRDEKIDTLLSSTWAAFKDGTLQNAEDQTTVGARPIRLSKEREARGAEEQPLVTAATEGYTRRIVRQKKGETSEDYRKRIEAAKEKGVLGVLAYMQRHGSGFERVLASAVARSLRAGGENQPKLVWITDGTNPRYDPKTNTVYIRETESPEVILHETLHSALQWFVYNNPEIAEVKELLKALDRVLALDTKALPDTAKRVIETLRSVAKGRSKTARLDAALELISYGSTLYEFQQVLKSMESGYIKAPADWYSGLTDLWQRITALVQRMLGVSNTVANDVLDITINLLEQTASTAERPTTRKGAILNLVDITTEAFKRWFGNSKIVNDDGSPKLMYHGTARDISEFRPKQAGAIFLTDDPEVSTGYSQESATWMADHASDFLTPKQMDAALKEAKRAMRANGYSASQIAALEQDKGIFKTDEYREAVFTYMPSGPNLIPMFVRAENPFDYENPEHVAAVTQRVPSIKASDFDRTNNWTTVESTEVQAVLKDIGFDSFYVSEHGKKNLAVYEPNQIKSAVGNRGTFSLESGNILESAVASPTANEAADTIANSTTQQAAQRMGYGDASAYRSRPSSPFNLTKLFFDYLGFGTGGKSIEYIQNKSSVAAKYIQKNMPMLERALLILSPSFGSPSQVVALNQQNKTQKNTAVLQMEYIVEYLHRSPEHAEAVINYLDGDKRALDGIPQGINLKTMADLVMAQLETFIASLPKDSKERQLFEGLKFSEYLLNPDSVAQLAGKSFGLRALPALLATTARDEKTLDSFRAFLKYDADGQWMTDRPLYQLFDTTDVAGRAPAGFIDKELADTNPPAGLDIDKSRVWRYKGFKDGNHKFLSRTTTPEQVREMARTRQIDKLATALLNTTAALSHNYSSRNFFNGLYEMGRENNEPTELSQVFDNIEQINKVFGTNIDAVNVLKVSSDESRMFEVRNEVRRTGTWVKLPDTPTYGALRGKYLSGPAWNMMLDMHDRNPIVRQREFNKVMTSFKKMKTVYSPATAVNNILSNYALMLLHGISHKGIGDAARLLARFELAPKSLKPAELELVKAFYDSGAVLGQYSSSEAKDVIAKAMMQELTPEHDKGIFSKLTALANFQKRFANEIATAQRLGRNVDARAMELYAAGDNIFRFAAFLQTAGDLQARDNSRTLTKEIREAAGLAARQMFLDYDIDSRLVRGARQTVLPFVSWAYAFMPVLGRIALHRPWALVNMFVALSVMEAFLGGEDDDELRKLGPQYLRERAITGNHMFIRLPFLGSDKSPVYYNVGKSIPFMSLFEPSPQEAKLLGQVWVPGFLQPNGPYIALIAATLFGIDPFTGKSINAPTDTEMAKLANASKAIYDTMVPGIVSSRNAERVSNLFNDVKSITGKPPDTLFMARMIGFSAYQFNIDDSQIAQDRKAMEIKREFLAEMRKSAREEVRKGVPDYVSLDKKIADLRQRMEERIAEAKGEE